MQTTSIADLKRMYQAVLVVDSGLGLIRGMNPGWYEQIECSIAKDPTAIDLRRTRIGFPMRAFSLCLLPLIVVTAVATTCHGGQPCTAAANRPGYIGNSIAALRNHDGWMRGGFLRKHRPSQGPGALLRWSANPCSSDLAGLDEPIVTDRPDFTEASSVVGLGVAQLEMGYTFTANDDGGVSTKSHSYPESLLRYGIARDWLELRIGWTYLGDSVNNVDASGSDDLYLGFKIGLTAQQGVLPEMAIIPQMTVPTGAARFTADETLPGLNLLYGWDLNDSISTAGSTQFNRAIDDGSGDAYTQWAQSWTIGVSLADRVGAYAEYFGFYPTSADTARSENYFNGGFTFLVNHDVLWDIRGGVGLDDNSDDYFVGTGLSFRWR
ncbi:MAG: transporter [Pirellulaceae bacterium]|nr:transporter [Pirellulaceae bacterium]